MKCEVCGRGPASTGDTIHRSTPPGNDPHWRCQFHLGKTEVSGDVAEIAALIERDNEERKKRKPQ